MQPGGCPLNTTSTDRIQKQVLLRAPVWQAVADARKFGEWFGVDMAGPFATGARVSGKVLHPGYEHVPFDITVERIEPERLVAFRWHPNAVEPGVDYSA